MLVVLAVRFGTRSPAVVHHLLRVVRIFVPLLLVVGSTCSVSVIQINVWISYRVLRWEFLWFWVCDLRW